MSDFRSTPLEKRQSEAARMRQKYPDRIPVILEKGPRYNLPEIDKCKYLIPADMTVAQFLHVVRRRINLKPEQAVFLFVQNKIPVITNTLGQIYDEFREQDGFVYFTVTGETVYGNR